MMNHKQVLRFSLLVAGIPALLMVSCARTRTAQAGPGPAPEAASVAVTKVVREDLARKLTLSAEFKPFQQIDLMAKVSGYVKAIHVDVGDKIRQGQLVAELEVPEMTDDLTRANAAIQRNNAEYKKAKDELSRAETAHQIANLSYQRLAAVLKARPGLLAQQEIDDAHSRDLGSEAQVNAAQSNLLAAEQQIRVSEAEQSKTRTLLNYAKVIAPFAGVVTKRYADTGSMIQAGTASQSQARPLITLSQISLLRLILPVPESAVPLIHIGQAIDVRVPSLNRSLTGRVARFANTLNLATRTMETEVDVPNADLVLVPGMFAEATLTMEEHKGALPVPISSVASPDSRPWVLVVNVNRLLERREVSLGMETADRVEVLSGLKENELVVIGSRAQLKPGQEVTPKLVVMAVAGSGAAREGEK